MLRVAANVVGDGSSSIRELVEKEKTKTLCVVATIAHLLKSSIWGDIELLMLEQQGYTPDTVLPKGSQTFLRGNSNISTGGAPLT